jgi:hypothetical protein
VKRKVGAVSYELAFPHVNKIHNVFHVSCLKTTLGHHIVINEELPLENEGKLIMLTKEILDVRERKLRNMEIKEYLVK